MRRGSHRVRCPPMRWRAVLRPGDRSQGFALLEALIAASLLSVVAVGVAQLAAVCITAIHRSGEHTTALIAGIQRLEQLRSLVWHTTPAGPERIDRSTDLAAERPSSGGRGLRVSPRGTLDQNVAGYVDYLDRAGRWVGQGTSPPVGTYFVRRWSIRPSGLSAGGLRIIQVVVMPLRRLPSTRQPPSPNDPGVVWLTTLRGRR